MTSLKRRRNDVEINDCRINSEDILDTLDNFPYLYRSIQSIHYMTNNRYVLNLDDMYNDIHNYIINIITKFFSGCKFFHKSEEFVIEDDSMDMYICTNLRDEDMEMNFSSFLSCMENIINSELKKNNIKNTIYCRCEGNMLQFWMFSRTKNKWMDNDYKEEENSTLEELGENDTYI